MNKHISIPAPLSAICRTPKQLLATLISLSVVPVVLAQQQEAPILEEIVVTAEHKEASLQDTQISITALSSADIKEMGINSTRDLGDFAPNVTMTTYQGGKAGIGVNIRGIGQNETIISYDPAVGVYVDDVLISKNVGALTDLLELERVEILRGPQGTLYGRNTMGGALNYVTKKPSDELEGSVVGTLGKFGQKEIKGMINLPLVGADSAIGPVILRVSVAQMTRDGLIDNINPGAADSELETTDRNAALAHLSWQPSDSVSVLYSYDRTRIDETPSVPFTTVTNPNRTVGVLLAPYSIGAGADRPDEISVDRAGLGKTNVDGHSLHIDYEISPSLTFKSITAKREMDNYETGDSDGSPLPIIATNTSNELDQFTQEFRFIGTAMDQRFDYSTGIFYIEEKGDIVNGVEVFGTDAYTTGKMDNTSWALYGQATYALTSQWRLTLGVRYTEEEKKLEKAEYNLGWVPGNNVSYDPASEDYSQVSPMASISYDWSDSVMTYFKVSSGYQSGGLNVRDANPVTFAEGYDKETLIAYELGMKADLTDRMRLNTALWYSDYSDKNINNFNAETLGNIVTNAESVEIYGLEVEFLALLTDNLRVGVNYGYLHPEFKKYDYVDPGTGNTTNLSDTTNFVNSPENTASVYLSYDYSFGFASLNTRLDWSYKDDYHFLAPQPELNSQQAYDLWNLRVSLDDIQLAGDTKMRVSLWGKNLTDESYYTTGVNIYQTFGFDINSYAEPRTYGIDLEVMF
ncbi:TonB-dependent receptor [Halioxenophilus sp. WMMB6]|uniref:TonB-dependent receptor n=1 Tax=Halioxenophilus sp. WMMB6 TaxID=3073815 RepID=UPI00295ED695|nr:TonB-dependent receptor [Halioxenophilus sp. WMMB6]